MERLRAAERAAKEKRLNLYASLPGAGAGAGGASKSNGNGNGTSSSARVFDAVVVRVWGGDQISVVPKDGGKERRIQLSSTRAPKLVLSPALLIERHIHAVLLLSYCCVY